MVPTPESPIRARFGEALDPPDPPTPVVEAGVGGAPPEGIRIIIRRLDMRDTKTGSLLLARQEESYFSAEGK